MGYSWAGKVGTLLYCINFEQLLILLMPTENTDNSLFKKKLILLNTFIVFFFYAAKHPCDKFVHGVMYSML